MRAAVSSSTSTTLPARWDQPSSPAYVDTTVRRWQQHTGGTPQRNGVPHSLEP